MWRAAGHAELEKGGQAAQRLVVRAQACIAPRITRPAKPAAAAEVCLGGVPAHPAPAHLCDCEEQVPDSLRPLAAGVIPAQLPALPLRHLSGRGSCSAERLNRRAWAGLLGRAVGV